MPSWLSIVGDLFIAGSLWLVYPVFQENSFGASTVEIVKDQKVISAGPYAVVRNPMYACAAIFFVAMAFALGSYWGLIPAVLTILGLVWRLSDEETFLAQNLHGYKEYRAKVRWRLIPGIFWYWAIQTMLQQTATVSPSPSCHVDIEVTCLPCCRKKFATSTQARWSFCLVMSIAMGGVSRVTLPGRAFLLIS